MDNNLEALYSAYGAYELKSKYQRNMFLATSITTGFVSIVILTFWLVSDGNTEEGIIGPGPVIVIVNPEPPPLVKYVRPQVNVKRPQSNNPVIEIPPVIADYLEFEQELLEGEEMSVVGNDELAETGTGNMPAGEEQFGANFNGDEYDPPRGVFIKLEIMPEMVYEVRPEYPRLAEEAGLDGSVMITVLVGKDGNVLEAVVAKSSGIGSLDDAALSVAKQNRFKPGIQNGRPVKVWVTYTVDFVLKN